MQRINSTQWQHKWLPSDGESPILRIDRRTLEITSVFFDKRTCGYLSRIIQARVAKLSSDDREAAILNGTLLCALVRVTPVTGMATTDVSSDQEAVYLVMREVYEGDKLIFQVPHSTGLMLLPVSDVTPKLTDIFVSPPLRVDTWGPGLRNISINVGTTADSVCAGNDPRLLSNLTPSPAGTFGSSTQVPVMTVNARGQVTGVTLQPVAGGGTLPDLNPSPAGTYGAANKIPTITVNAKGQVTSVTAQTINTGTVRALTAVATPTSAPSGNFLGTGGGAGVRVEFSGSGVSVGSTIPAAPRQRLLILEPKIGLYAAQGDYITNSLDVPVRVLLELRFDSSFFVHWVPIYAPAKSRVPIPNCVFLLSTAAIQYPLLPSINLSVVHGGDAAPEIASLQGQDLTKITYSFANTAVWFVDT